MKAWGQGLLWIWASYSIGQSTDLVPSVGSWKDALPTGPSVRSLVGGGPGGVSQWSGDHPAICLT